MISYVLTASLILSPLLRLCAQQILVHEPVAIKVVYKSPLGRSFVRTNLYNYQLRITTADSTRSVLLGTGNGGIKSVAISHNEQLLALTTNYGFLEIWSIPAVQCTRAINTDKSQINQAIFTTDDKYLITSNIRGTIRVFDLNSTTIFNEFDNHVNTHALKLIDGSPERFVSGDHSGNLSIWQLDGTLVESWKAHDSYVLDLDYDSSNKLIYSSSHDNTIKQWNLEGELLKVFSGHDQAVYTIDLSPDGLFLVSGGMDKTARLWSIPSGVLLKTFQGHTDYIFSVLFYSDSKILTGSRDCTLRIWDY